MHIIQAILDSDKKAVLDLIKADPQCMMKYYVVEQSDDKYILGDNEKYNCRDNGSYTVSSNSTSLNPKPFHLSPVGCAFYCNPNMLPTLISLGYCIENGYQIEERDSPNGTKTYVRTLLFSKDDACNNIVVLQNLLKLLTNGLTLREIGFHDNFGRSNRLNSNYHYQNKHTQTNVWQKIIIQNMVSMLLTSTDIAFFEECLKQKQPEYKTKMLGDFTEACTILSTLPLTSEHRLKIRFTIEGLFYNGLLPEKQRELFLACFNLPVTSLKSLPQSSEPLDRLIRNFLFQLQALSTDLDLNNYKKILALENKDVSDQAIADGLIKDEEIIQKWEDSKKSEEELSSKLIQLTSPHTDIFRQTLKKLICSKPIAILFTQIYFHRETKMELKKALTPIHEEYAQIPEYIALQMMQQELIITQQQYLIELKEKAAKNKSLVSKKRHKQKSYRHPATLFAETAEVAEKDTQATANKLQIINRE